MMKKYLVIIIAAVILDRIVKWLTVTRLGLYGDIDVIRGVFRIIYVENTGAAFSMFNRHTWLLSLVTAVLIAVGLIILIRKRKADNVPALTGLAMAVGGGIGNLFDRIVNGYVVDMFDLSHFAVFNVADIFVCVGAALICIGILFFGNEEKQEEETALPK